MWLLACAVSFDGFVAGLTYGMRRVKIPVVSVGVIAGFSGGLMFLSLHAGHWIAHGFSPFWSRLSGALILIGIGVWTLFNKGQREEEPVLRQAETGKTVLSFEIRMLGLVVQILKTPMAADVDRSGVISPMEAVWLGLALSLDAFGAGLGAAMVGYPPFPLALAIAGTSALFLLTGIRTGWKVSGRRWVSSVEYLPGLLMIAIGLFRLID
ncbi:sporulation membrane protein YtaF [Polycladomyces sp. WAk]|uniref:Sporulation membrane protein YtaF n=2 Tax=Polycladomyces zharkentensis TaxID=2807616 RepID=A0ABS2WHL4_9BACL|nr:sporulation membrane protein YtaF [Polycladomyces sp. WAk]